MSGPQLDVKWVGGTQIAVGLSALIPVRVSSYQIASTLKIVGGAGTLWISPIAGPALSGSSAAAQMAAGYPLGATEVYNIGGPATFYLSAATATMTVGLAIGYTSGYTSIT